MFDVSVLAKEVGVSGEGVGRPMVFRCPLQFGAVDVLAIESADSLLRGRKGVPETGNRYGSQQTDDSDDDHDFDEGESCSVHCVHGIPDILWFALPCVARTGVPAVDDKVHRIELRVRKKVPLLLAGENGVS